MATKKPATREATLDDLLSAGVRYRPLDDAPMQATIEEPPSPSGLRRVGDVGLSLVKGAIGVPEAMVGMADLVSGGRVGKFLENEGGAVGFRPQQAKQQLDQWLSPQQQAANEEVNQAKGVVDTGMAALRNPSVIGHAVAESVPLMLGGGVIARALMKAAPISAVVAGSAGEGIAGAGMSASQIRQESRPPGMIRSGNIDLADKIANPVRNPDGSISTVDSFSITTPDGEVLLPQIVGGKRLTMEQAVEHYRRTGEHLGTFQSAQAADAYAQKLHDDQERGVVVQPGLLTGKQSLLAAGSGLATGALGYLGGRVAQKMGLVDIDTLIAGKAAPHVNRGFVRQLLQGAVAEGVLEELPQSVQEQVAQNLALDRPLDEGVDKAIVLGTLAGMAMGAGGQVAARSLGDQVRQAKLPESGAPTRAVNAPIEEAAKAADAIQPVAEAPAAADMPPGVTINTENADPALEPTISTDLPSPQDQAITEPAVAPAMPGAKVDPDEALTRMERQLRRDEAISRFGQEAAAPEAPVVEAPPDDAQPTPEPADIGRADGQPFANRLAASRKLKALGEGYVIASVDGGYVLRKAAAKESADVQPADRATAGVAEGAAAGGLVAGGGETGPVGDGSQPDAALSEQAPLDAAANGAATSPANDLPEPTEAQKKAGNYAKGHVLLNGLDLSIENPAGSTRSGVDRDGKAWTNTLQHHYGYIKGSVGNDKDHVDVFVKPGTPTDYAGTVFVVDQVHPDTGRFDEHKALLGFADEAEARAAYAANYAKDWKGLEAVTAMPFDEFKAWVMDGPKRRAAAKDAAATAPNTGSGSAAPWPEAAAPAKNAAPPADPAVANPETGTPQAQGGAAPEEGGTPAEAPEALRAVPSGFPIGGYYATDAEGKTIPGEKYGDMPRRFKTAEAADKWARAQDKKPVAAPAPQETTPAEPTHKDPGEPAEAVTPEVVAESVKTAAAKLDRKPSEMKAELLAKIDAAMADAKGPDDQDVLRYEERGRAKPDRAALMRRYGRSGRELDTAIASVQQKIDAERAKAAENIGFVTFDVPGDGVFKVVNTKERLAEFRRKVETSPGFKDKQPKAALEDAGDGVQRGSGGPKSAIENMIDDGDPQAAVDYAAARGLVIADVLKGDKERLKKIEGLAATAEPVGEFEQEEAAAPAPDRPAEPLPKPRKPDAKAQAKADAIKRHFTPGNIVKSYGGEFDEVLEFREGENGGFSVRVHHVTKSQGSGQWVRIGKPQDARWHATAPDARELAAGPVAGPLQYMRGELVSYTEGRADGRPFTNAPDRGVAPDEQHAAEPPAQAEPAKAEKPSTKIEDFGSKLEGARKDYAAKLKDAQEVDIAAEPLSKSWPEPDYDKMLADGADPFVVAFIHAARDEIPTKPQRAWKLRGWVETVTSLRETARSLLAGEVKPEKVREIAGTISPTMREVKSRAELYQLVGHSKSLKGISFAENHYSLYRGQENVRKWVVEQKAKATAFSNWPRELAVADTKQEMLDQFASKFMAKEGGDDGTKAPTKGQFVIYRKRGQEGAWIGKKIGREYIDLHKADDVAAARKYLEDRTADLEKALEKYRETPFERKTENAPRVGDDHRNGAPVTPEVFAQTFGFRGVQFGNYVEQGRRQSDLNEAFDGLMDLAAVLGVPPRALSLDGRLGLAFGARGRGGKNAPAAHFEPDNIVINLTKGGGPGSLAHEWWHSADNYFAANSGARSGFITGGSKTDGMRTALKVAFDHVKTATRMPTLRRRAAELDKRRSKPYWNTELELSARAFESYVIAKLQDQGAANDYLANIVDEQVWNVSEAMRADALGGEKADTYPYPLQAEMPAVRAAFDDFFKTVETSESDGGSVAMFSIAPKSSAAMRSQGLPADVVEIHGARNTDALKAHADYAEAKAGDAGAAARLVTDLVTPADIAAARQKVGGGAVWAFPHAEEATGHNMIPAMMASRYAAETGGTVAEPIVQVNRAFHTGADAMQRLIARPLFDGPVTPGARYVIVDDVSTMGGTLAEMANHIRHGGGEVVAVVTLENAGRAATLTPLKQQITAIERSYGQALRDHFRIEPAALTRDEASYVLGFRDADALRGRAAAAERARSDRLRAKGLQEDLTDGGEEPSFSRRRSRTTGVSMRDAEAIKGAIRAALPNAPEIVLHDSVGKAPEDLLTQIRAEGAQDDVEAVYWQGRVHVFPANIASIERAEFVIGRHEIRHHGMRTRYGGKLDEVLLSMWRGNADLRSAAQEIIYGGRAQRNELAKAIEEALADMPVERIAQLRHFDKLVATVRQWLRRMAAMLRRRGMPALADAIEPKAWTDNDVAAFVLKAEQVSGAAGSLAAVHGQEARFSQPSDRGNMADMPERENAPGQNADGSGADRKRAAVELGKAFARRVEALAEKHGTVYVRWSPDALVDLRGPQRSRDFLSGETHAGLSAVPITSDLHIVDVAKRIAEYSFARIQDRNSTPHVFIAKRVGTDSDGYASVKPTELLLDGGDSMAGAVDARFHEVMDAEDDVVTLRNRLLGITDAAARQIVEDALAKAEGRLRRLGFDDQRTKHGAPDAFGDIRFSRAPGAALGRINQQSVRNAVNDLLSSPGKVSWWDKTIGTQYAKAQKYARHGDTAGFKTVFDAVQDYHEDISTLANEAADAAPAVLPKLENWRDLAKSGLSKADAKAVAAPVFEGTLEWARAADGELVRVDDMKAAAEKMDVHDKAQALFKAGRVTEQVLKMWRGLPLDQFEAIIAGKYEREFLQAGVVFSDAELRDVFKLTDSQISQYRQIRRAIDTSLDQAVTADVLRQLPEEAPIAFKRLAMEDRGRFRQAVLDFLDTQEDQDTLRDEILGKYDRIDALKARGYAPLMRFGKFFVNVADRESGESLYFGLYESRRAANAALREMREAFPEGDARSGVISQQQHKLFAGVPLESLEMFAEAVGATQSDVYQQYIKLAKNNRSAMKRLLHRKGTAGFSDDLTRVLAAFLTSNARLAAGSMNLPAAAKAAQEIRAGDVKDEAVQLIEAVQNPTETAAALRGLMFVNFIGGSVASAAVNLTQTLTMTLPYLTQWGGLAKATGHWAAALKQAAQSVDDSSELGEALKRAEADGIVAPQEIHHLQAEAMGSWGTNPALKKAAFVWGSMFSLAEQFNRRVTFIAAYQTAREHGMADPFAFAEKAVVETQGLYNRGNAANWARNPVGATALQFKQFTTHYLEWLGRMWRSGPQGRRAVGYALAVLMLAAGSGGLPGSDDLDDLVDTLAQALGYDFNSKAAKERFLASMLGKAGAEFVTRGISGIAGMPIDVSLRMGMGNLVPGTGLMLRSNTDSARDLSEVAGAAGGMFRQLKDASEKALAGDVAGAAVKVAPVAIQNIAKAVQIWTTGQYRDERGRKVMDASTMDGLMKFVGFQPAAVAAETQKVREAQRSEAFARKVETEIVGKWARGLVDGEPQAVRDAQEELRRWNQNNPRSPIRISRAQVAQRARKMRESRAERFTKSVAPERRAAVSMP